MLARPKKGEVTLTVTARMMRIDGSSRIIKAEEMIKNYVEIPTDLDERKEKSEN